MASEHDNWHSAILPLQATMQDAIKNLNDTSLKIVLVVDGDNQFIGAVSDGDVRRALLNGRPLSTTLGSIANRDALVVSNMLSRDLVRSLMKSNQIYQIPIVGDDRRLVGLHLWEASSQVQRIDNELVIMAGGEGKRLRPYTENCPKPLIEVGGKPILGHIIERVKDEGFVNVTIAINYLGWMIEEYCGDGSAFGVNIKYLRETSPLGTAGAISLMAQRPSQPIVVTNGDVFTDIKLSQLLDFHNLHTADATMAVKSHEWQNPFGVVVLDGVNIVKVEEKPLVKSYVNAGVYVLCPSSLDALEVGSNCDMPDLFQRLKEAGKKTVAYPMHEPWVDIGRPEDLKSASSKIQS